MPEVAKILPNYLNYAVAVIKGFTITKIPNGVFMSYTIRNKDGAPVISLEGGRPVYSFTLQQALQQLDNYATDLNQAWLLMKDLPYNVRADILRDEWDTDNPADLAYKITSVWIIAKNKDNPTGAAEDWWDKIATFVPRADSEFGEEWKPSGNTNL